jgi:hypothetical protein
MFLESLIFAEVPMRRGFPANRPRALASLALLCALTTLPACSLIDVIRGQGGEQEDMSSAGMDMSLVDMSTPEDMSSDMASDMNAEDMPADMTSGDMAAPDDMPADAGMDMLADMPDMPAPECGGEGSSDYEILIPVERKVSVRSHNIGNGAMAVVGAGGYSRSDANTRVVSLFDGEDGSLQLTAANTGASSSGYSFGFSVAISPDGNTIAVGAPDDGDEAQTSGDPGAGRVYILKRPEMGMGWSVVQTLAPTNGVGVEGELFGYDLAYTANSAGQETLVIGAPHAPRDEDQLYQAGAVYVFARDVLPDASFAEVARHQLPTPEELAGDPSARPLAASQTGRFGHSVAADGSWHDRDLTVIVGAPSNDLTFEDGCMHPHAGAAYLLWFDDAFDGQSPGEAFGIHGYVVPDLGGDGSIDLDVGRRLSFGKDVAITGTLRNDVDSEFQGTVAYVVGAPDARDGAGEVYVGIDGRRTEEFTSRGPGLQQLTDSTVVPGGLVLEAGDHFGSSVDIVGMANCGEDCGNSATAELLVVVGARDRDLPGQGSGAIYGFELSRGQSDIGNAVVWDLLSLDGSTTSMGLYTTRQNIHMGNLAGFGQDVALLLPGASNNGEARCIATGSHPVPVIVSVER